MKNEKVIQSKPASQPKLSAGLPVRSDVRAGAWNCSSCEGQVMGSQLYKSQCDYCQQV